ncbi:unnamed protein product [Orchesella dallaii]|uniref:Uncharacterized protein n=1 Tax=Orchesella dallaii TaxID=48710 RepID=A0ABP1RKS1_9HEXA
MPPHYININFMNFPACERFDFLSVKRCKTTRKSWNAFLRSTFRLNVNTKGRFRLRVHSNIGVSVVDLGQRIRQTVDFRYTLAEITLLVVDGGVPRTLTKSEVEALLMK